MEITRKEKRAKILAFCGEVTKGYSTPRGTGFCTITRSEDGRYFSIKIDLGDTSIFRMVHWKQDEGFMEGTDFLYCILGLETRAVMDYMEANFNEMIKDAAAVNQDLRSRLEGAMSTMCEAKDILRPLSNVNDVEKLKDGAKETLKFLDTRAYRIEQYLKS